MHTTPVSLLEQLRQPGDQAPWVRFVRLYYPLIYHWAQYVEEGGGSSVSIGISPVLGSHDTLICHTARGEDPLWRDQLTLATSKVPVDFSGSFFNDGATQYLEVSTVCSGGSCGAG